MAGSCRRTLPSCGGGEANGTPRRHGGDRADEPRPGAAVGGRDAGGVARRVTRSAGVDDYAGQPVDVVTICGRACAMSTELWRIRLPVGTILPMAEGGVAASHGLPR